MNKKHLSTKAIINYLENGKTDPAQTKHLQGCTICSEKMAMYRKLFTSPQHKMNPLKIEAMESALYHEMDNIADEGSRITASSKRHAWRMIYAAGAVSLIILSLFLLERKPKSQDTIIKNNGTNTKHPVPQNRGIQHPHAYPYDYLEVRGYQFRLLEEWKTTAGPLEQHAFSRIFGGKDHDTAHGICQTADGGYVAAGHSFSLKGSDCDIIVVKFDSRGRTNWVKTLGGKFADEARGIIETRDHGFLVCGYTESFNASGRDGWVIKLDKRGTVQWANKSGSDENDILYAARQTGDNGYILAGYTYTGRISRKAWVLKLDSSGKQVWSHRYGDKIRKAAYAMDMAANGEIMIAGSRQLPDSSHTDVWLQKMSPSGKILWEYTWGGEDYDVANAVRIARDGSCYFAGHTQPKNSFFNDYLIQKISADGKMLWSKTAGFSYMDQARCLALSQDGSIAVAGESGDPHTKKNRMLIYSLNPRGKILWEKVYSRGFGDGALAIQSTRDDGLIVAGYSVSKNNFRKDIWLLKLDSNGMFK